MRGVEGYSLADIAAATGNGNNGNNGFGGFGGDGWAWIIVLFLIFGWGNGRNGFGGNGNNGDGSGSGAYMNYVLNSDFATLQRLIADGFNGVNQGITQVNNGLCQGFFNVAESFGNTNMAIANGFGTLNTNLCQSFNNVAQQINGISTQISDCCCQNLRAIDGVNSNIQGINYNLAMNTNQLQNAMCSNTRDIIESQNNGTRAILDAITANRIEDKNAQIQAQQNEINALRLSASQAQQSNYIIDELRNGNCPIPSYLTCNPRTAIPVQYVAAGYNNGCGCGNY